MSPPALQPINVKDNNWSKFEQSIHTILSKEQTNLIGVLVSGYPGTGKSYFVENYLSQFSGSYPQLIVQHHHQHKNIPFAGFKFAISDYLSKLYYQLSSKDYERFSYSLKNHFGENYPLLLDYIPELSLLAGSNTDFPIGTVQKIENQLYSLIKTLFEFVSSYFQKPIFFFTDDLQWIGTSEINLLKYLLSNLSSDTLIWIGACRTEHDKVNHISQFIDSLGFEKKQVEQINIENLNEQQTKAYLENQLGHPCSLPLLKTCYSLSEGHLFHLQLLTDSLKNSGLIKLNNGHWVGDIDQIIAEFKGLNLEKILSNYLGKLSSHSLDLLDMMACVGSCDKSVLLDWLDGNESLLDDLLKECRSNGIIEEKGLKIHFQDRHVGELIYQGMSKQKASAHHYEFAKILYQKINNEEEGQNIILAANHLNQSISEIRKAGELQWAADLNYHAGSYSKKKNALEQSKSFFKMSCDLLKECKKEDVSQKIWQAYIERAKVEYYLGEYDLAEIHLDYLLDSFYTSDLRTPVYRLKIIINNHLGKYKKALQILNESLAELGVSLPGQDHLNEEVNHLIVLLHNEENKLSENHSHTPSPQNSQEISDLLNVGGMALHHTSDVLMTWAALQIILRSNFIHNSGVKAIGYVSYARMRIIAGEISVGLNYGKKALEINKQLNDLNLRCRVFGVYAFYILPWSEPFSNSLHLLKEGIDAGRQTGDLIGMYILKTHQLNLHFISGLPLPEILKFEFDQSLPGVELTYYITHYQKTLVNFLIGNTNTFSLPLRQSSWQAAQLTIREEMFYRNYVWARYYFLFGYYDLAEKAAFEANENRKLQEASPLVPANSIIRFLAITQNWHSYNEEQKAIFFSRLKSTLEKMEKWQKFALENYTHNYWLLRAEWLRINGDYSSAQTCFLTALDNSGTNLYQLGITHELYSKYLFSQGKKNLALNHLNMAIEAFTSWGAKAKVDQLIQQYQAVLVPPLTSPPDMDMETVQRELSGDLKVDSVVNKLMVLLMRISGSTKVVVKIKEEAGDLVEYGQLSLLYEGNKLNGEKNYIPESLLFMSHRTQCPLIINDVYGENTIRDFALLKQKNVKAFSIMPLTITGQLSMVIYLETIFAKHWYDDKRLKEIRIVANQGAIIIENAQTHEKSIQLNEEIRKEMDEKQRLAMMIEKQKDKHLKDLVDMQDAERNRIASELHDSLGSLLSTVKMRFNNLQEDTNFLEPLKAIDFEDALYMLDDAIEEVRKISHSMSSASLKRFGIQPSLQSFIEKINAANKMEVELQLLGMHQRLPDQIEVAIYRICQELVQNVIKHAEATHLSIQMINHENLINIIVDDNGKGMDLTKIKHGFGFLTIQSKIALLKGTFNIESRQEHGTMIIIDIPLT